MAFAKVNTLFCVICLFVIESSFSIRRFERDSETSISANSKSISFPSNVIKSPRISDPADQYTRGGPRPFNDEFSRQGPILPVIPGGEVTNYVGARLELSPESQLFGAPGQIVNIGFLLTNLAAFQRIFYISVNESPGGFFGEGGSFPLPPTGQSQFLNGLSERQVVVRQNEIRKIVVSLRIPPNTFIGANRTITIEAQEQGGVGGSLIRRFYFSVDPQRPEFYDQYGPYCEVLEDTRSYLCSDVINNPLTCRQRRWTGKFYFIDYDSGLRSLMGRELFDSTVFDVVYSYTNFIIGTKLQAQYSFQISCCTNSYSVSAFDLAGNEETCVAGEGATVRFGAVQIAITVVVLLIVLAAILAGVAYIITKKKRNAELAKLSYMHQPR